MEAEEEVEPARPAAGSSDCKLVGRPRPQPDATRKDSFEPAGWAPVEDCASDSDIWVLSGPCLARGRGTASP